MASTLVIGLNAVIVAVTDDVPRILTVQRTDHSLSRAYRTGSEPSLEALPFGPLDPEGDRTLELGLRGWVREQTGMELGYAEQLYTFGDRDRRETRRGPRVISVSYLALVRELRQEKEAFWRDCYQLLPWEDWRSGAPDSIRRVISPHLRDWVRQAPAPAQRRQRRERVEIAFGLGGASWDEERVLDRYELLYEAGLVSEAEYDLRRRLRRPGAPAGRSAQPPELGHPLILDHRRILATALGRLRGKIKYRPVVFELLPPLFTLLQLQRVVEALAGVGLHKQNFRRLVEKGGLVEGTGRMEQKTGGRPAELFRFRREVLRERPAPGVGLPGAAH